MKTFLYKLIYSMPVQLLFLHLRRYQVLLLFWILLFAVAEGSFGKVVGAVSLLLAPEYLGEVSFYSTFILGSAYGIFVMSWQITTFILNSKRFRFLATTSNPFAKYCLNNFIIPLLFLLYFLYREFVFQRFNELSTTGHILFLVSGFILGFLFILFISFTYFFGTDRTITRAIRKQGGNLRKLLRQIKTKDRQSDEYSMKVDNYLNSLFHIKRARNVDHYDRRFLDSIFNKHHSAAIVMITLAFIFLIILSYLTQYAVFRIPAGASVIIFISVLIALSGFFVYLFKHWALPVFVLLFLILNIGVRKHIIDTRSLAYGLDYTNSSQRPSYNFSYFQQLFTTERAEKDKQNTLHILQNWKNKFSETDKPPIVFINVTGGGSRSATWCMDVLQTADSILNGQLMGHTVLITGASGGMIAAAYYRELYLDKIKGQPVNLYDSKYVDNVSKDLLNSVMSSFAINDFFTPFRNFKLDHNTYPKDRGYAFEHQLNINLNNALGKPLGAYKEPEQKARIPMMILSPTIVSDGRKLLISPQRLSYLTYPVYENMDSPVRDIDGIDFVTYFSKQQPLDLLFTTAIRMNATFPYILPNVFLPTKPIIEVMDAGLRDNYGKETSLRFIHVFRDWINNNTGSVIFIQIRGKQKNKAEAIEKNKGFADRLMEPLFTMQHTWSSLQDYEQNDLVAYAAHFIKVPFHRLIFQYVPREKNKAAALNWHLTEQEKADIADALKNKGNQKTFRELKKLMNK